MPNKYADIEGLEELLKDLKALDDQFVKIFKPAMQEALFIVQGEVHDRTPIGATGNLAGSINIEVKTNSLEIIGEVGTNVPYGIFVEEGTRPHRPPIAPLIEWVERMKMGSNPQENRRIAYAIASKIARRGTEGQYPFRDGFEAAKSEVEKIYDEAVIDLVTWFNKG